MQIKDCLVHNYKIRRVKIKPGEDEVMDIPICTVCGRQFPHDRKSLGYLYRMNKINQFADAVGGDDVRSEATEELATDDAKGI